MDRREMLAMLERIAGGELSPRDAARLVEQDTYEDLGFAKLDHQRKRRMGFPEVVYAQGKQPEHLLKICRAFSKS